MSCADLTVPVRLDRALSLLVEALPALAASFAATAIAIPFVRRLAHATDVVDKPDMVRKLHGRTVAYLGGTGVFLGVFVGILASAIFARGELGELPPVPFSIVLGMVAITFTGLADDIWKFDARLKIAGQLVAAAALAMDDIGVNVAVGLLSPFLGGPDQAPLHLGAFVISNAQIFYWAGTALVAIFVIGGANAANLLDGLDGLLAGITTIMCIGLLALSAAIVFALPPDMSDLGSIARSMAGARIVLCMSLLGACLGFLVYNYHPASIFLGDAGSLLIGFLSVTIVMTFANLQPFSCPLVSRVAESGAGVPASMSQMPNAGYEGYATLLVMCGLAMFGLPLIDTTLAIIRRRRAGVSFSTADANHLHHRFKRRYQGSVRKAVGAMYCVEGALCVIGLATGLLLLLYGGKLLYPFIFLIAAFVATVAIFMHGSAGAATGGTAAAGSAAPSGDLPDQKHLRPTPPNE